MVTMTAVLLKETMDARTRVPTPRAGARTVTTAAPRAAASRGRGDRWRPKKRPPSPATVAFADALRAARAVAEADHPVVPKPKVFPLPRPDRFGAVARATYDRLKPTEASPDRGPFPAATRDPLAPAGAEAPVCPRAAGTVAAARWAKARVKAAGRRAAAWAKAEGKVRARALKAWDRAHAYALVQAKKEAKATVRRETAAARRATAEAAEAYRLAQAARSQAVAQAIVPFLLARREEALASGARGKRKGDSLTQKPLPRWTKATAHLRERAKAEAKEDAALDRKIKAGETLTSIEAYKPWRRVVRARFDPTPRKKRDKWGVARWTPPIPKRRPTTRAERDTDPAVALTHRRRQLARRGVVQPRGVPLDPVGALAPSAPPGPKGPKGPKGSGSR